MSDSGPVMTGFEFCLLGPLIVRRDGARLTVPPGTQRVILAMLLLNAGRVVRLDELAEALWAGRPPPSGPVAVQNYVMRLRKTLGDDGRDRIITQPPGYLMRVTPGELDVSRFEVTLRASRAAARDCSWDQAARLAQQALKLWRGEPLADVDCDLLAAREASRLAELRLQALETRIGADLHLGRHNDVIVELRQLTSQHPLREHLHRDLMLALYRDGRQAEALAAYASARRILNAELGTEPGTGLRRLQQQILTADPDLDAPPPAAGTGRVPQGLPASVRNFTGRAEELQALNQMLAQPGEQAPGTVVISAIGGTAGVGKTTLAVHWAHQVAGRFPDGQLYANLRGYDPAQAPAAPAEVARRFLNSLGVPDRQIPLDPESAEILYRSSLVGKRLLIVLDNARDAAQVRPLLPSSPGCLVLVTSRSQLSSLAASHCAHMLTVDLLSKFDARELITRRLGRQRVTDAPQAVTELVELCARLPLALSIAAARAAARPAVPLAGLVTELRNTGSRLDMLDTGDPGSSIRAVFSWSYNKLTDAAARMFRLLSVHPGPDFTGAAAASLAGMTRDQARRTVSELTGSHLLTEHTQGRFAFHDLLRAYAADQSRLHDDHADRRAALHRLLDYYLHTSHTTARLLDPTLTTIPLTPPQPGALPEAPGDYEQAWAWIQAEHQVLLATATQAASTQFQSYAWKILHALGPYLFRQGLWHEFALAQHTALNAATRADDTPGQAHMHRMLGRGYALLGSFGQGHAHLTQAMAGFRRSGNRTDLARTHIITGTVLRMQERYSDALDQARRALRLYRAANDPGGQAGTLNNIGLYHIYLGDYQQALTCCQQALTGFDDLGNRHGAAHALDTLGYAHHFLGHPAQAITCYQQSLDAFREHGDRFSQADTLTHLGDTHHAAGNLPAARHHWQAALDILSELHHPDTNSVRRKLANLGRPTLPPR